MKKTNALRLLDKAKINYDIFEYEYDPVEGSAKAIAAGSTVTQDQVYKTLVGKGNNTGILVAVVPSLGTLDFKKLCQLAGNKKMTLVAVKELQGLTGYIRGGCSPLGMKKKFPVFIDASLNDLDMVYVNAGQRGILMGLAPDDLVSVTEAVVGEICV